MKATRILQIPINIIRHICMALLFLTHLPLPQIKNQTDKDLGYSVLAFPIVGLFIGIMLAAIEMLLKHHSADIIACIVLTFWVLITGGLHIDGLADSADAWIGGHGNFKKTFDIMKDPACGPMGVTAIVLILLIKFAAIKIIIQKSLLPLLILTPILSRTVIIALFLTMTYVRQDEIGNAMSANLPKIPAIIILFSLIAAILLIFRSFGLEILMICLIAGYLLRKMMIRRIGGLSGDVAGAAIELLEALLLMSFALW